MNNQSLSHWQNLFFFDLSLADVYGIGCAALSLIYYGSRRGVFHLTDKESVDLDCVDAIQISLIPRTVAPLSDRYDYNLVYFRKDLGIKFWDSKRRRSFPQMKKLIRRVVCSDVASVEPNRLRQLYIRSNRPVHVAQYSHVIPTDDYVPVSYVEKLKRCFEGYLIRSPKGYPLVLLRTSGHMRKNSPLA